MNSTSRKRARRTGRELASVDELITTDRKWLTARKLGLDFTITLL